MDDSEHGVTSRDGVNNSKSDSDEELPISDGRLLNSDQEKDAREEQQQDCRPEGDGEDTEDEDEGNEEGDHQDEIQQAEQQLGQLQIKTSFNFIAPLGIRTHDGKLKFVVIFAR